MRVGIIAAILLTICIGCNEHRSAQYDKEEVNRVADSLSALMFIQAAMESGMPSYYHLDRKDIVVMVDTASLNGRIENYAADLYNMAYKHNVKAVRCIVCDYKTEDTLYIYNKPKNE